MGWRRWEERIGERCVCESLFVLVSRMGNDVVGEKREYSVAVSRWHGQLLAWPLLVSTSLAYSAPFSQTCILSGTQRQALQRYIKGIILPVDLMIQLMMETIHSKQVIKLYFKFRIICKFNFSTYLVM